MRAYNNRSRYTKSNRQCGYCRQAGHNATDCPHIEYDQKEWAQFRVPHQSPTLEHCRWFINDYSYWIKQINKYYPKWLNAKEKRANPSTTTRPRTARKCGFCGDPTHTRRTCPKYTQYAEDLKRANANYRKALYSHYVENLGLGVGSAVKLKRESGYGSSRTTEEFLGIITNFNLDDCNVFQTERHTPYDYKGSIKITALVDGQSTEVLLSEDLKTDNNGKELFASGGYGWYSPSITEVVGRSTQPLDEEWATNGLKDEFAWILKKRTADWLRSNNITRCVDNWK